MKTKKILALVMSIIFMFSCCFTVAAANPVSGDILYVDTRTYAYNSQTGATYKQETGTAYSFFTVKEYNNNPCYCIEKNAQFTRTRYKAVPLANSTYWATLTATAREGIALAAAFGYPAQTYSQLGVSSADDAFVATQVVIWEYQTGIRTSATNLTGNTYYNTIKGTPAETAYNTILTNIGKYVATPQYDGKTDELVGFVNFTSESGSQEQELICFYGTTPEILSTGYIEIYKKNPDGALLDGAEFTVYDSNGNYVTTIGPTVNGYAKSSEISFGTYTVVETKFPPNYQAGDKNSWSVTLDSNHVTVVLDVANERQSGNLKVLKKSEDGKITGCIFALTGTDVYGRKVNMTATTDANGVALFENVPIGTGYTLEEKYTPNIYVIPEKQTVDVKANETVTVTVNNILKKWRADILKVDGELYDNHGGGAEPELLSISDKIVEDLGSPYGESQGNATLEGAVYGVYQNGELVKTYTTDKNGYFLTDYFPCGNDWTIKEISPSPGYLLDETVYHMAAYAEYFTVELNTVYYDCYEQVIKGNILIAKHSDIAPDGAEIDTPEKGAEFEVFLKSSGSYENAKESERDILVTDEDGFAITKDLPYGTYTVKQTKGLEGTDIMKPFDVYINEEGKVYKYMINNAIFEALIEIVKKDAETGKIIPAAGIGFKIKNRMTGEFITQHINYPTPTDLDVFYTNENGMLMLPEKLPFGQYEVIEQCTADGYVLDKTPVQFTVDGSNETVTVTMKNMAQKGIIKVSKTGEIFSSVTQYNGMYKPFYIVEFLEGATFEITAAEDIVTPEGTVRYKKDEVVAEITTTKDGKAESIPLYLGKYSVKEIKAPAGMVINSEAQIVELTYAGEEIELTEIACSFFNERQKLKINLKKELEKDFGLGTSEIKNVYFALYATEDIIAADGTSIPKDGLIEIAQCDMEGNIVFSADLPVGSKAYVREYATDNHYILSDKIYPVEFEYAGQEIKEVTVALNEGNAIENKLLRGNVIGKKTDIDGNVLAGVTFGLFRQGETEFTKDKALLISVSGEDGIFRFENIPYGIWLVRELETIDGYMLNTQVFEVNIDEDGCEIEVTVVNEKIPEAPKTGDDSKPWIPAITMLLSGISLIGLSTRIKKRKEN